MVEPRQISDVQVKGRKVRKNLDISKALFRIIFESIDDSFAGRETISRSEIGKIQQKLMDCWPQVETLFDNTCAECTATHWYIRDERRKDALTRLVFAKVIMRVHQRPCAGDNEFPRVIMAGLQVSIATMFSAREWKILNDHAKFIFDYIGSDYDGDIATQLKLNPAIQLLCQRIFISLLARFAGFNTRRKDFIHNATSAVAGSGYVMSDLEFCEVFEGLFREYHDMLQGDDGRLRLTISHSEEFVSKLDGIFSAYFRYKSNLPSVRVSATGMTKTITRMGISK
ncbi:hypothetical protein WCLP8_4070003 [uncultured Gammaproteobacteria bacterium]